MPTQTGSLDLKSGNDAAKTATNYITEISTTDGIKVHNANDTSNYAQINSSGMNVVRNEVSVASFGASARVGKESGGHTIVDSDGMRVYRDGTEANILANIGYGNGKSSTGTTVKAPFYTLGQRVSNSVIGNYSMAEGLNNTASGFGSHAEGNSTTASGVCSHSSGMSTTAEGSGQTVIGILNAAEPSHYTTHKSGDEDYQTDVFIIGNGYIDEDTDEAVTSNAFAVQWDGDVRLYLNYNTTTDDAITSAIQSLGWTGVIVSF